MDTGLGHDIGLYRGERGFLDAAVPFVLDGLTAGEVVWAALPPAGADLLRGTLGGAADELRFFDVTEVGRNPARLIPLLHLLRETHEVPVRGLGEPIWPGRGPAEITETLLHESLVNVAFGDTAGLRVRCLYDAEALDDDVLDAACRRHPRVVGAPDHDRHDYGGAELAAADFTAPLPAAPDEAQEVAFGRLTEVRGVRGLVGDRAAALGADQDRVADLSLAVHEIAVNSLRHGGTTATLRLWWDATALVCEVRGGRPIEQPLVGRVRPGPSQLSGRGLWLANELCDLVQIRSSPAGTVVRLHLAI